MYAGELRTARVLLGSLLVFLLIEHFTFNRFYPRAASPDSTTGHVELMMGNERKRPKPDRNQVLIIGNSRMSFFPRYTDPLRGELGYTFATIASAGTQPRCWYYMLRDEDPTHDHYRAVVIPLEDFDDNAFDEVMQNRYIDQRYILQELHLTDIPEFAGDFLTLEGKLGAARDIALKGYQYQADFLDLLRDPSKRLDYAEQARRDSHDWFHDYRGPDTNVAGLKINWEKKTVEGPAGMSQDLIDAFRFRLFMPIRPADGVSTAYDRKWLGKIVDLYRDSGTTVVFIRLARGAYIRPDLPPMNPQSVIRKLAGRPGVIVDDVHTFESLEDPAIFLDPLHFNGPGEERFSILLARHVSDLLRAK